MPWPLPGGMKGGPHRRRGWLGTAPTLAAERVSLGNHHAHGHPMRAMSPSAAAGRLSGGAARLLVSRASLPGSVGGGGDDGLPDGRGRAAVLGRAAASVVVNLMGVAPPARAAASVVKGAPLGAAGHWRHHGCVGGGGGGERRRRGAGRRSRGGRGAGPPRHRRPPPAPLQWQPSCCLSVRSGTHDRRLATICLAVWAAHKT